MRKIIFEWVRDLVFYQLIVSIIMNAIPKDVYMKYVRFFLGVLFITIAMQPILKIFDLTETWDLHYLQKMMEQELEENNLEFFWEDIFKNNEENE